MAEFKAWPKTPRLFRDITITEKIDGTNAAIIIEAGDPAEGSDGWCAGVFVDDTFYKVGAQSRKRIITPGGDTDNAGLAGWVQDNAPALVEALGEGYHYGEWWGKGIQRNYGQATKHFSLFNVHRYADIEKDSRGLLNVVPVLYQGENREHEVREALRLLSEHGSLVSPGYMNPEGIIVFHSASNQVYKVLIENDELPKGLVA